MSYKAANLVLKFHRRLRLLIGINSINLVCCYYGGVIYTDILTHFSQCCVSCRNQSFVLQSKPIEWFVYETQHWINIDLDQRNLRLFHLQIAAILSLNVTLRNLILAPSCSHAVCCLATT